MQVIVKVGKWFKVKVRSRDKWQTLIIGLISAATIIGIVYLWLTA